MGRTLALVAVFIVLMLVVGRRVFSWLLREVARTGSRELFTLCVGRQPLAMLEARPGSLA